MTVFVDQPTEDLGPLDGPVAVGMIGGYGSDSSTVSTVKKSQASIVVAWVRQNSRHDRPVRRGAGSSPALRKMFQTVAGAIR